MSGSMPGEQSDTVGRCGPFYKKLQVQYGNGAWVDGSNSLLG